MWKRWEVNFLSLPHSCWTKLVSFSQTAVSVMMPFFSHIFIHAAQLYKTREGSNSQTMTVPKQLLLLLTKERLNSQNQFALIFSRKEPSLLNNSAILQALLSSATLILWPFKPVVGFEAHQIAIHSKWCYMTACRKFSASLLLPAALFYIWCILWWC